MTVLDWAAKERVFVRQYARAVTGDQAAGDAVAAAALRDFDFDAIADRGERERRVAVFRRFFDEWRNVARDGSTQAFSDHEILAASPFIADRGRQLALLTDILGIAPSMAGALLELRDEETRALLASERQRIANEDIDGRALVIEDEPLIAMDVAAALERVGLKVIGTARSAEKAVEIAEAENPEIVLADYDLGANKTGLDAIREISARLPVVAIFLTAYPEEALSGDDIEPTFVLKKPFDERALRTAVAHGMSIPRPQLVS